MYIPVWVLWTGGVVLWLMTTLFVGRPSSNYDFVSPILGAAVFFIGLAFGIGCLVGR
jgi:hypothetical protein